ncbi:DUF4012 domain-containing protein [uncultured Leifsonia sp.]|uniref:DUF4012 domain-containing protein n=1 Tax=uncultured Leifsonia sp. TaxID=340359 RepID=UPI0028D6D135|nr:DUF4012 domain-containing protein [uncultured Leifsonia sp.]
MWAILVLLIVIAAAAWVGVRGLQAKQQLDGAMPLVTKLKAQVLAQDTAGAKATYAQLAPRAAKAASLTSDPVWRVAELVPGVGANLSVTRTLAAQTDAVVTGAIRPLVDVSGRLSLESLKPKDGRIDVAALTALRSPVSEASATVDSALRQVKKVDTAGAIGQVASAKTKLVTMLTPVAAQLGEANSLLSIVPKVLGVDKPRNYLLAFQNNGEIMPGGGTIGSMAILHVENGSIQLTQQASAADTDFPRFGTPPLTIPAELSALYPNTLGYYIQNLTETPRFSESYAVAKAMWKQQKGVEIDGMVAVDVVALSQFLAVTGPIDLPDGTQLTSANAAQTLLIDVYKTYTAEQVDQLNQGLSAAVFGKLLAGDVDPKKLASFVATASAQHRILLWSDDPAEQAAIRNSAFYGAPPTSTADTDAFGVYLRDITPSKLAVYLDQSVNVSQAVCGTDKRSDVRVTITLKNTLPPGTELPHYVAPVVDGHIRLRASTYAPHGYTVAGVTVSDGAGGAGVRGTDGEYVVQQAEVTILPGETRTVTFDLVAPHAGTKKLSVRATPAVTPTPITTGALDCGSWKH